MIGALIGGGMSLLGGLFGSSAAKKAAEAQARATQQAIDTQNQMFRTIREDQAPYRQAGSAALNQLMGLYGLGGIATPGYGDAVAPGAPDFSAFYESPDYLFARDQGEQAVLRNRAALGGLASGNTGAALQEFGQGLATQNLGNYRNTLMGLIQGGQGATNTLAQAGMATSQGVADSLAGQGNARASGIIGSSNALTGALGQIGGIAMDYFGGRPQAGRFGIGTTQVKQNPGAYRGTYA
jgi:hypothetical protein